MKQKIQQAFIHLLETHPLHEITIKQIAAGANIHRATFYVYFSSRDELYETLVEDLLFDLEKAIQPAPTLTFEEIKQLYIQKGAPLEEAMLFLKHIQQNNALYQILLKDIYFQQRFSKVISDSILQGNILPDLYTQHMAYGAIGLVMAWLQFPEKYSQYAIAQYLTRTIVHSILDFQLEITNSTI